MKLASAEVIIALDPIEKADKIEVATVLGWKIVVKKGEFKVGDLVTYIQIDTVVPKTEQFAFLLERKYRVRSIRLRGQISQGLITPLPKGKWKEGDDLTDVIGITKYTKDVHIPTERAPKMPKIWYKRIWWMILYRYWYKWFPNHMPMNVAPFPSNLVQKTDEERIQNMPWALEKYRDKFFTVTEKLNGSSITLIHDEKKKDKVRVCSRNQELIKHDDNFHKVVNETGFRDILVKTVEYLGIPNVIFQGEYIGKPQGNYHKIPDNQIRVFNIFVDGKQLLPQKMNALIEWLNIPACPVVHDLCKLNFTMEEIIKFAEGKSIMNSGVEREGLVFRCIDDGFSFKVISNKYLLENEE